MITRSRILALLAVLTAVAVGYWLQREQPSEKLRVRHPQAYSVCAPQDWSAEITYGRSEEKLAGATRLDGLTLMPNHFAGRPPRLTIGRFAGTPDPDALRSAGWVDGTFQDQPAFLFEKKAPRSLSRGALFERAGQWFEVSEGLSVQASLEKDDLWRFLETFRAPDGVPPVLAIHPLPTSTPASTMPFTFPAGGQ